MEADNEMIQELQEAASRLTERGLTHSSGLVSLSDAAAYILKNPQTIDTYAPLDELLPLRERMTRSDWLTLLGQFWAGADNTSMFIPELRAAIGDERPVMEMMTDEERLRFDRLPQTMTVYRGCGAFNANGICWSLSSTIAREFHSIPRYKVEEPLLLTGTVEKARVVALKRCLNEDEIISFDVVEIRRD
jgi:hypothetical protein